MCNGLHRALPPLQWDVICLYICYSAQSLIEALCSLRVWPEEGATVPRMNCLHWLDYTIAASAPLPTICLIMSGVKCIMNILSNITALHNCNAVAPGCGRFESRMFFFLLSVCNDAKPVFMKIFLKSKSFKRRVPFR